MGTHVNSDRRLRHDWRQNRLGMFVAVITCCILPFAGTPAEQVLDASIAGPLPAVAVPGPSTAPVIAEPEPLYAEPSRVDRAGRVLARVEVNGRGPFRFIIDSGANRSAISTRLMTTLGLVPSASGGLAMHGVTGTAALPWVDIDTLRAGDIFYEPGPTPVLADEVFADADGILGVEGLRDARVEIDFRNDSVTVRHSAGQRAAHGYLVVPARLHNGGLLLVNGKVGRQRVKVILDTGAERSIGNLALFDALQNRTTRKRKTTDATVTGATPGSFEARAMVTPLITIGEVTLKDLIVTFGDLHVFNIWGLANEPALLVGMDLLGTVNAFVIDYPRREFQVLPVIDPREQRLRRRCGDNCTSVMRQR
jgi:predicted aspartyl protease